MANSNDTLSPKKPPYLILLLFIAIPIAAFFVYRQNQQISGEGEARASANSTPDRDQQLSQAKLIRGKFENWAMKHKEDIANLRKSSGESDAPYRKVFDAIPVSLTSETGLTADDFAMATKEDPNRKHKRWEWTGADRSLLQLSGQAQGFAKASIDALNTRMKEEKEDIKDCLVSKSINGGLSNYYVWSSGRVTEGVKGKKDASGATTLNAKVQHNELVSAYDFIK